jgi:hypothetical protein
LGTTPYPTGFELLPKDRIGHCHCKDVARSPAEGYERQVASATSRLTAAIEPILIVVLAVFVGFILFATILPILEAGNVL